MNDTNTKINSELLSSGLIIAVVQDVLKRWHLIIAAALIAAMAAFIFTDYQYEPEYKATTTFVVTSSSTTGTTYNNLSTANNTASVFTEVLNSSILKQKVLEEIGLNSFIGEIKAEVVGDTNLLTVTVKGPNPRSVFLMSKAIIKYHHIVSDEVLNNTILEVLRTPIAPTKPINSPVTSKRVVQASLLAATAVIALLSSTAIMSDKIRSKEEADTKLSCHVLGELYHEKKNKTIKTWLKKQKKSILITDPLTSFIYTESIHKLSSRVDKRRHKGERVIMITSFLENEGKSTVAVNLALSMTKKGKKVLLIDADLRKPSCNLILGHLERSLGITDVLQGKVELEDCVKYLEDSGLYLLTCRKSMKTAVNLANTQALELMLKEAASNYDFVIVDTPPMSVAPDTEYIAAFVDAALLVVRQNAAITSDLNTTVSVLSKSTHMLGCVLNNMYGSGNFAPAFNYGSYNRYGKYGKYSKYGYGKYGYGRRSDNGSEEKA